VNQVNQEMMARREILALLEIRVFEVILACKELVENQ
jgi:hypothetical protein